MHKQSDTTHCSNCSPTISPEEAHLDAYLDDFFSPEKVAARLRALFQEEDHEREAVQ